MSASQTVPMFSPDGTLGDVPYEQMVNAKNAGAVPAVKMQSPDGSTGYIPANKTQDAVAGGGKILPIEQQDTQHPGFWHSIFSDIAGIRPSGVSPYPGMDQEAKSGMAAESSTRDQARKDAGYSQTYRALAPAAEAVGTNVQGMEESAKEGDVAGVAGHATTPIATIAAAEGAKAAVGKLPSFERAKAGFEEVSRAAAGHSVPVTPELSKALMDYQQAVDAGGSHSTAVRKLINRLTSPDARPLTYEEARLFQSNISRLSADETNRLTPVMKKQIATVASALNGAVENTASNAGKLQEFRSAMKEYRDASTMASRKEILQKWATRAAAAAALGATGAAGVKLYQDLNK